MKFGDILRELIDENNISQKQLADDLNIANSTVGNYIRNLRQPDFEILKLFATYFNVSTDYLLNFQHGYIKSHDEDNMLRIFRSLSYEQQQIYIGQGKVFVKSNLKQNANANKSSSHKSEK